MGEAAPAQSAAGAFAPMLGVAVGSMSGGVGASRGSAVPQLHSAIVERLRARIALCRRHHSTCESRYQRGQAETTDREHESTLHLLNIVQQGPGTRKSKASRASNPQPPEYSRANGEQRGPDGDQKVSMRMALHGSLRRKIEGQAPKPVSCPFPGSDFKRARMDGPGHPSLLPSHSFQGSTQRKHSMTSHGVESDIFNMTLREMKKEPAEVQSCSQSSGDMIFDFKDEGQLDPELQDLFDELTKAASPLNELEFEKMLKQDEAFGLDLGRPSSVGAVAALGSPLDKPIKLEHSPDFGQVQGGSPQLRPASAGPAFASQKVSAQSGPPPRAMPCWPEISHAEQLKQMAAANQQPGALLHHHQQQAPGLSAWSPGSFPQDGLARVSAPSKGINHCLFKSNGHSGAHHLDMKALSSKPTLHFSPKPALAGGQPLSKSATQRQHSPSSSQLHFQNQQMSTSAPLCLQSKPAPLHAGGLPFKLAQGSPSGPRQPVNGSLVPAALRPPAASSQMKAPGKRQDKDQLDQFSRHLTRPPPEYKLSSSVVGVQQQSSVYSGPSSQSDAPHKMNPRFGSEGPPHFQRHLGPAHSKARFLGPNAPGTFGLNSVQPSRAAADQGPSLGALMSTVSWAPANKQAGPGPRRPQGPPADMYPPRPVGPPDPRMLALNPGQPVLSGASPEQRVPAGSFADPARANRVTFDFLPEGDNSVPGINTDSDFIDSLLKSGSGNDDWMKDINLDEILGSGSII
ncbi:mastermind-like protein 2 [Synchiropus splendidus]|uniref:mastermind-like protein 2 n=1 Tax=Synchiropus splendidus TaxID=270530 RepID=UPI00237D9393|nr:mastermind-like protein 2 [Synchiropus splendidus]